MKRQPVSEGGATAQGEKDELCSEDSSGAEGTPEDRSGEEGGLSVADEVLRLVGLADAVKGGWCEVSCVDRGRCKRDEGRTGTESSAS